jgi:hypothetical protein
MFPVCLRRYRSRPLTNLLAGASIAQSAFVGLMRSDVEDMFNNQRRPSLVAFG